LHHNPEKIRDVPALALRPGFKDTPLHACGGEILSMDEVFNESGSPLRRKQVGEFLAEDIKGAGFERKERKITRGQKHVIQQCGTRARTSHYEYRATTIRHDSPLREMRLCLGRLTIPSAD